MALYLANTHEVKNSTKKPQSVGKSCSSNPQASVHQCLTATKVNSQSVAVSTHIKLFFTQSTSLE